MMSLDVVAILCGFDSRPRLFSILNSVDPLIRTTDKISRGHTGKHGRVPRPSNAAISVLRRTAH